MNDLKLAQTILRAWNGGAGFNDEYFEREGKRILAALKQLHDEQDYYVLCLLYYAGE